MGVFKDGGYEIEYYKYGGCYQGHIVFEEYATKAEALNGIREFHGYYLEIKEYPGNGLPGKRIDIADLEEPVKEKKKKKKKKKKEIGWIQD